MVGDLILEVNGQDIRKLVYSDVAFLLKTLPQGKVALKIGRFRSSIIMNFGNSSGMTSAINLSSSASSQQLSQKNSRRNSLTNNLLSSQQSTLVDASASLNSPIDEEKNSNFSTFKPCLKK